MASLSRIARPYWLLYLLALTPAALAFYGLLTVSPTGPDYQLLSDPYFFQMLEFTLWQAGLSAILSVLLAIPIAHSLYFSERLPGKRLFLQLCLLCFVCPSLVVVTAMVALLGRSGLLTPWLTAGWNLYGLAGILLAHLFLNTPLAVRTFWLQLQALPNTSWRLAAQLKLTPGQRFWLIEWPVLKSSAWMLLGFIFVLCFNSFAVVLALGGGPASTTLEVAIYQALKYDFNIPEALTLAWSQLLIVGGLYGLFNRLSKVQWQTARVEITVAPPLPPTRFPTLQRLIYGLAWILLLLPFLALLPSLSDSAISLNDIQTLGRATLVSLVLALLAALLAMALALGLLVPIRQAALAGYRNRQALLQLLATHTLVTPAMVLCVGLYILLLNYLDLERYGIVLVLLLNSALLVPFAIAQLQPALLQYDRQYERLAQSLKLGRLTRWRLLWSFMRPDGLACLGLILVLALGDVAIFSIFAPSQWSTLPWLIYGYAGSYQMGNASLAALILLLLCILSLTLLKQLENRIPHAEDQ